MKTGEDFKKTVQEHHIEYWPIHNCSMCNYLCGFLFNFAGHEVVYDAGCNCTRWGYSRSLRDWDNVAEQYNLNIKNADIIKKYNEFWKFNDE
jgi:hypothetical protein